MTGRLLVWELLGAVVGAGLASGKEIASFFARYGAWGYAGIAAAVSMMGFLADGCIPPVWHARWSGRLWQVLLTLLLVATGGGMLSAAGHVTALSLPVRGAYWIGVAAAFTLAYFLARRTETGLAWVSRGMLAVMLVLIGAGLFLPPMRAVQVEESGRGAALLRGVTYGGFNAALLCPVMGRFSGLPTLSRRRAIGAFCLTLAALLSLGCGVLLRHPALIGEAMPFVVLMRQLGRAGYLLGALCLYMAILSTLTACLRGLSGNAWACAGMIAVCLLGFDGVVNRVYPLLGAGCFAMLAGAKLMKIRNSFR